MAYPLTLSEAERIKQVNELLDERAEEFDIPRETFEELWEDIKPELAEICPDEMPESRAEEEQAVIDWCAPPM